MTVAQRVRPARRIESQIEASPLSDISAAANVGARLAVSQVQNGFVDAPAIRRRFEQPHLLRKLPEHGKKESGRASKIFQFFGPYLKCHALLLRLPVLE